MSNDAHFAKILGILFALASSSAAVGALASPATLPGGADAASGVSGNFSQVLFNGMLRLRNMSLKDAVAADNMHPNAAGERALVFRAVVSNGTHHENHGFFNASLADADGITITGRPLDDGWSVEQGAAARTAIGFSVPANFVPAKLVLVQAAVTNAKPFRLTIRPSDLAAAPKAP